MGKKEVDVDPDEIGDPLELIEKVMQWIGLVTIVPKVKPRFYWLPVILEHVMYVNCYLATTLYFYEDLPFYEKMESFQCFLSLFHMLSKYLNLHYNTGPYRKLVARAKEMWDEAKKTPENKELMKEICRETEMSVKMIILMFAGAVPTACLTTLFYNLQVEPEKRQTLYLVWTPAPDESWYWTACTYQGVLMAASLNTLAVTLSATYAHCLQAAGQMKIMARMLQSESLDVRACARLHQKILLYVSEIQDYFAGQLFLELFLSALQNACRGYMCLKMASNGDPKAVGAIFILVLCMSGPFIDCLCGHVIMDNSEKVFLCAYQSAWYNCPQRDKSGLLIIMTMSSKIIRLHYRGLLDFSMERYSMVTNATYSYITLLKGADVQL